MPSNVRGVCLVATLVLGTAARATGSCASFCADQVAACKRGECSGLDRDTRRQCVRSCKGRAGCPGHVGTLAYVVTTCRLDAEGLSGTQELRVRHGDCNYATVVRYATLAPTPDPFGLCAILADGQDGFGSVVAGVIQRLGVTPDGSGVVFEVTNAFQLGARIALAPEEQGFFYVRADGTGLRRIAPPSKLPAYAVFLRSTGQPDAGVDSRLAFSPDGRVVAYRDFGPGPAGETALQVFSLDTRTGRRSQLTTLPRPPKPAPGGYQDLNVPRFSGAHAVVFSSFLFDAPRTEWVVKTDDHSIRRRPDPTLPAVAGGAVKETFQILPPTGRVLGFLLSDPATFDPTDPTSAAFELFWRSGRNLLQVTNFKRYDTDARGIQRSSRRVVMTAAADPLGTNPSHRCQFFDVGYLGGDYRQLTRFGDEVGVGCYTGCRIAWSWVDATTRSLFLASTCNLVDQGTVGMEVFSLRPDGSGLRQLTRTAGVRRGTDGTLEVEMPGPYAVATLDP